MHEPRELLGEPPLRVAGGGVGGPRRVERTHLVERHVGEPQEAAAGVIVVEIDPILIEAVGACAAGIEPDRTGGGLPHLRAVGLRQQRAGDAVKLPTPQPTRELDPGGDVAPLVAAAELHAAVEGVGEVDEVPRLKEHVAEFGVGDAVLLEA